MAYTKATNKAVQKYSQKAYDKIQTIIPKGSRDKIKEFADNQGMSVNSLILRSINEYAKSRGDCLFDSEDETE